MKDPKIFSRRFAYVSAGELNVEFFVYMSFVLLIYESTSTIKVLSNHIWQAYNERWQWKDVRRSGSSGMFEIGLPSRSSSGGSG
jgi:hypothetical protein